MQLTEVRPKAWSVTEREHVEKIECVEVPDKSRGTVHDTQQDRIRSGKEAFDVFYIWKDAEAGR